jgi:S-DNA-T family DNA segregation ATPase FtsK/SpoIIIE
MQYAFPAVGSLGAILFVLINPRPLYIAASTLFALSSVAMGVGMYLQQRSSQRRTMTDQRHRYMVELETLRRAAIDTAVRQHRAAEWTHPDPGRLWTLACSRARAWERRRADVDFLVARLGRGRRRLATPLRLDVASPAGVDPLAFAEAQRLVARHGEVEGLPITVDLARGGRIDVGGGEPSRGPGS